MPCVICTFLTTFGVLVTAPTNTLYASTMIVSYEGTQEDDDKADETSVVDYTVEAKVGDKAEAADDAEDVD